MTGTIINVFTVAAGSIIGLLIHSKLPDRFLKIIFQAAGLFTLSIGISMALKTGNFLIAGLSILTGSLIGESLNLEKGVENLGLKLKALVKSDNERFAEGIITPFLLFCTGSMTILGCFEEGLGNPPNLLLVKSMLDGFVSISFAATLGIGVLFSVIPLFIFQGSLTLAAGALQQVFTETVITDVSAVGGVLLIGLGINLLDLKKLNIINMLPALVIIVLINSFFPWRFF